MIDFPKRVLFLGYGAVAQCALPIFVKHFRLPLANITVLDFEDRSEALRPWTAQGVRFVRRRITPENLGAELAKYLSAGDLLIDLAWNIDCCEILQWCHDHGVLYLNTSVEVWDPYTGATDKHPTERTLYWRHMNIRRMTAGWREARAHRRPRARRQPGPDLALDQAGTDRHRRKAPRRQKARRPPTPRKSANWSRTRPSIAWR